MLSVTFFKVRFTPSWKMLILTAVLVSLFLRLGFWQLHRADEKEQMLAAQKEQEQLNPIQWDGQQQLPLQYQRLKVEGHYLPQVFLLDNQHYQHQFGYNVVSAFEMADGSVIMVDRGWVPGDLSRQVVPEVKIPQGDLQLAGMAYFPNKNQWILGPNFEQRANNTIIFERFDKKLLSQVLQKAVYPFIIRLDKQNAHGFVREWKIVSMPPQRHLAYALQWFAMALVLLIIFVALNLKKRNEEKVQ